jgi:thiopeptide-type bacteriocin biosynthesis protein
LTSNGWISLHVFYATDSTELLTDGIRPLIASLREAGLIDRWFFISYWLEGPHLRVRLLPSGRTDAADQVREIANARINDYLKRRPALWEPQTEGSEEVYKTLFLAEYTEEEWTARYGEGGKMIFRPNNSVHEIAYEPEYDRYGGSSGIEVAEWHFEQSSDTVVDLFTRTNAHVRTVLLGLAVQLAAALAYAFLESDDAVGRFFLRYRLGWEQRYDRPSKRFHEQFDESLTGIRSGLLERFDEIKGAIAGTDPVRDFRAAWIAHAIQLRARQAGLYESGDLSFGEAMRIVPSLDLETVLQILLTSYIHMTNNRLGVQIQDEVYLSYLISKALGVEQEVERRPSVEQPASAAGAARNA